MILSPPRVVRRAASQAALTLAAILAVTLASLTAQVRTLRWLHPDGTYHTYHAVTVAAGITWDEANRAAARAGGILVSPTSATENAILSAISIQMMRFDAARGVWLGPWLGGLQAPGSTEPAGGWAWADLDAFAFTNWSPNQPDNANGADRLHFGGGTSASAATWDDSPGTARMPGYVMEFAQQNVPVTVGVLRDAPGTAGGYTLIAPGYATTTFLIDPRGRIVNQWQSGFEPGQASNLLPNGHLLRAGHIVRGDEPNGGTGGILEEFDWQGNLVWSYRKSSATEMQHHDVEVMPNGNMLIIVWDLKSFAEAVAAGRDPRLLAQQRLWPDKILEIEKAGSGGNIVWEWHTWDHLIQDFDATKANYGDPAQHPERVDLNYAPENIGDWMHTNCVDYNPTLDQIMISVRSFDELWIIDHSTTTAEAAGSTGGRSGKGGDLLYRWGNPRAYRAGTLADQQFFKQHDAHWIPPGRPGAGNILVFNNGRGRPGGDSSTVMEIVPPPTDSRGNYPAPAPAHGPVGPVWEYVPPDPGAFYTPFVAGAQREPNGNTLMCSGWDGFIREIDAQDNPVWEYNNPVQGRRRMHQGELPVFQLNSIFRANRYPEDYAAFRGRTLVPQGGIEAHGQVFLVDGATVPRFQAVGGTVDFTLRGGRGRAGQGYVMGTSATPGLLALDARYARLGLDPLFVQSVFGGPSPVFQGYLGTLDANGEGQGRLAVPPAPVLIGLRLFTVAGVEDAAAPSGIGWLSNTVELELLR